MPPPPKKVKPKKKAEHVETEAQLAEKAEAARMTELHCQFKAMVAQRDHESQTQKEGEFRKDRVLASWEADKWVLRALHEELSVLARKIEEEDRKNMCEINEFNQRLKHFRFDHQQELTDLRRENLGRNFDAEALDLVDLRELGDQVRDLRLSLHQQSQEYTDLVWEIRLQHDKEITEIRRQSDDTGRDLRFQHLLRLKTMNEDLDAERQQTLAAVAEAVNLPITQMINRNIKEYTDLKKQYITVCAKNLETIWQLKQENTDIKGRVKNDQAAMTALTFKNASLREPLRESELEMARLSSEKVRYDAEKDRLKTLKEEIKAQDHELADLKFQRETLFQRKTHLEAEAGQKKSACRTQIYKCHQKDVMDTMILERKLTSEATQQEILAIESSQQRCTDIDYDGRSAALNETFATKKHRISGLTAQIDHLKTKRQQMIGFFQGKLAEIGVVENLCHD